MTNKDEDYYLKFLKGRLPGLTHDQQFRILLKKLREQFPPDHPVKVRRRIFPKDLDHGYCSLANIDKPKRDRYYVIHLNAIYPWNSQIHTLLHEWAHTLAWHLVENGKDHGDIFHRYFGNLYRAFIEN